MDEVDPYQVIMMQISQAKLDYDSMLSLGQLTRDEYDKKLACLSYEFALGGYIEDCVIMLLNISVGYFGGKAIEHFKEDSSFFDKCSLIFEILSYAGYVPDEIFATQKPAAC